MIKRWVIIVYVSLPFQSSVVTLFLVQKAFIFTLLSSAKCCRHSDEAMGSLRTQQEGTFSIYWISCLFPTFVNVH